MTQFTLPPDVSVQGNVPAVDVVMYTKKVFATHPNLNDYKVGFDRFASMFTRVGKELAKQRESAHLRAEGLIPHAVEQTHDGPVRFVFVHEYDGEVLREATLVADRKFLIDWFRSRHFPAVAATQAA